MTRLTSGLGTLALLTVLPAGLAGQQMHRSALHANAPGGMAMYNEFSMEPYAGVFFDPMTAGDSEMGPFFGVRVGYQASERTRLLVDFGYSEVNEAGTLTEAASTFSYGNDWIFTMGRFEFDVVPGPIAGTISLMGGAAWRQVEVEDRLTGVGEPSDQDGYSSSALLAPGVGLRVALGRRAALRLSVQDLMLDVFDSPDHAPALTLGLTFR